MDRGWTVVNLGVQPGGISCPRRQAGTGRPGDRELARPGLCPDRGENLWRDDALSMPAPVSDVPTIRASTGQCTVCQGLRLTRSLEHLPSLAFFEATEHVEVFNEAPFTPCTVAIGADLVLTGYCDPVEPRYEKRGHEISVAVRSKTSDLVDCSVDVDALAARAANSAITARP